MRKLSTFLFLAVLLLVGAINVMAQNVNRTFTVTPSKGSYNQNGWCSSWTSNDEKYPITKISVAGGINNLNQATTSGGFEFAVGSNGNSNYIWNFTVQGYEIVSYSFNFVSASSTNVTLTAGDKSMTSSSSQQTWSVEDVNAQVASFQLTGSNNAIIVTNLTFTVREILEAGQVYMFKNARSNTDRSLSADGTNDVHTKATDANDVKQQWYVTKDGNYYVLRNLACGKYLKGNGQSSAWSMTDDYSHDYNKFELYVSNTTYNTLHTKTLGTHAYMHDSNNGDNGGYEIVGWTNADDAAGSHWTITKVNYTAEQIKALLDAAPTIAEVEAYDDALEAIFTDGACVALKDNYASMSVEEIKADANYIALPATLQKAVLKIKNNEWSEANANNAKEGWDSEYAKKFRVQMYEPYSIAGDITSWVGINTHANNDNPTGIYVPATGTVYVMVEGEIAEGATLRLVDGGSNNRIMNATTGGYTLQPGLNVVNFAQASGMLYICYNVDTYNSNGVDDATRFPHKLSDYAPLKIHIEGGAINGFYNACGDFRATTDAEDLWKTITGASVDEDSDWEYMETRANLSVLPVLGHRQILLFQLDDVGGEKGMKTMLPDMLVDLPAQPYNRTKNWADYGMGCDPSTGKINIMVEAWDRIMYSELATMGLVSKSDMERMNYFYPRWNADGTVATEIYDYSGKSRLDGKTLEEFCGVDYSEVFNHHGVALGTTSGYMYGGDDHCGYNINTFGGVVLDIAKTAGSTWGPGHEIGHQHQELLTLNGLTEVTNNLFANIAMWYKGMSTSRYNGNEGSLEYVLNAFNTDDSDIYTNNIWALTHMYYRLWLYYHLAGNNTQFYPRLFELLRHNPMVGGANVSGDTSTLHFYKLACQAAGEDLTEFFRVHGYFSVMEDRFVGDYSNSTYNVSQDMIDEAIAEVKGMGYPENLSIIFINDDDENANYLQHDGQTKRVVYSETIPNSDFGSVSDFIAGNVTANACAATLNSDGTITMSGGECGVGILILNEKGEVVSFSNKTTFALSDEAMETIVSGKATIKTVDSENNLVEAEIDLTALQRDALGAMISKAQLIVDKIDNTYTKIGYFKKTAVAGLESALGYAKGVYAASSGYEAAYDLLYAEYTKVLENKDAKIPFNPSLTYIITNYGSPSQTMWVNGSNVVRSEGGVDQTSNDARWKFKATASSNVYNIHTLNNKYIPAVQQSASMNVTDNPADDALYTLEEVKDGVWAIKLYPAAGYRNLHTSWNNVVGWETGADASRWYLTAVEADPVIADLTDLEVYINKTELLLDEVVGAVTYTKGTPLSLQTTTQNSAGYLWSNAPEYSEGSIDYLLDGITGVYANYFHTDWSSEPASGSHYLAVYLGENNDLSSFTFSHTTRSGASADFPKSVDVYGSDDNVIYKYVGSASNMPQSAGTAWDFDGVMLSSYKYLRFNYHANRGYWHMAEFDITPVTGFTATVNDAYSSTVSVDVVTAAMNALQNGKRTASSISPTTDDIETKLNALQTAYNTLYAQYEATINARKATLAALASETETLLTQVGEVQFALNAKLTLTEENLYCNAPYIAQNNSDYSAAYVDKLTDGSKTTFLHTDYSGSVAAPHYLRVDFGSGSTTTKFKFNYSTRDNGNNCPTTILIEGCDEADGAYTTIATLTTADGLPNPAQNTNGGVAEDFESSVIAMGKAYRFVRFKVTGVEGGGATFFVMSEFGLNIVEDNVTVYNAYKEYVSNDLLLTTVLTTNSSMAMSTNALVTSVPLLDAQIADQTAAKVAFEDAMARLTVDKTALQSLYNDALALYGEMVDGEGNVNDNYRPSALTNEKLAEAKTALDTAKDKLENATAQGEIENAKTALQVQYDALLAIKNANVADTIDKSELDTAIADANALIEAIVAKGDDYYASVTGLGIAELSFALQNAQAVIDRSYFTEVQYNEALGTLNACYTTTNGIVALDCSNENRNNLAALIGNVNTLLSTIAIESENNFALPLQTTDAADSYYIWCNSPASDSDGVAGLIDKNADGTANTGTFLGTNWGNDVPAYTHYIEVDFGAVVAIDHLTMDYTTRNSTHADQRPNAIKISGSNNKTDYTEITEITEGLVSGPSEKWTMPELLELGDRYRYIRIAVGSERGFFHMSDFNLFVKLPHTLKEYYTTAEGLDFATLSLVLDEAQDVAARYMTAEQYTAIYDKLNACYTTADEIVDGDYTNHDVLAELVADATDLVNDVVAVNNKDTVVVALQATDENAPYYIYCNAPGVTNNYSGDNLGVAALLDVDDTGEPITATFLHSSYVAGSHDDDLDHYLRVDMGEDQLVEAFKFRYTPRIGNTGNAPLVMLIEGSNDCVNFEEIITLTDMSTTYQSGVITNGKAYRYIRFMVKDTHNHSMFDDHKFFAMSHFEMTTCCTVAVNAEYASPNLSVGVVANAYNSLHDAAILDIEHYIPNEAGTTAKDNLQAAYDALNTAVLLKNIPVVLTTDVEEPVLYKIKIKSNGKVFEYDGAEDGSSKNPVLDVSALGNKYQAWYFMQGDDEDSNDDIFILPYYHVGALNTTQKLGYPNINGSTKPVVSETGASSYNWYITFTSTGNNVTAEGWWNLQPQNGTSDNTFVNQQGGGSSTVLSFWKSTNNPNDNGSQFQFIPDETDYSLPDSYFELYELSQTCGGEKVAGNKIGMYIDVDGYNIAYNAATELLEAKSATDDEYALAKETLSSEINALERRVPVEDRFYILRSAYVGGYSENNVVYVGDSIDMYFSGSCDELSSRAIWQFESVEGGYLLKNFHTGAYVDAFYTGAHAHLVNENAGTLTYEILDEDNGILNIKSSENLMHAQESGNKIVGWGGGLNTASAWYIEEISNTDIEEIYYPYTLSALGCGTLMLGFDAVVPEGVTAYYAESIIGTYVHMEPVSGILPTNTAVILKSNTELDEPLSLRFKYSPTSGTPVGDNMLAGTLYRKVVKCDTDDVDNKVYVMQVKNGDVKMYCAYENYGANGKRDDTNGGQNDNGGHIMNSANRAYLVVPQLQAQQTAFNFRFGAFTDVETAVDDCESVEVIYDLQGRKVANPTKGIYIINGRKVVVK